MDFHEQKANLSFSIENILRDDFSHHHRRQTEAVNLQTREACFESWPCQQAVYRRCYLAPYSPYVLMKYPPPATQRVAARFQWRVNGSKAQRLPAKPKSVDDDCLSCKDEAIQKDDDDASDKDSKPVKCLDENAPKRKRRNRSHFTQRQLQQLQKIFSRQQYLTRDERAILARGLEMTELQIRNWFQNRRYQRRHRTNENTKLDEPDTLVAT